MASIETDTVSANKESFKDLDPNTMTNLKPEYKRKLPKLLLRQLNEKNI